MNALPIILVVLVILFIGAVVLLVIGIPAVLIILAYLTPTNTTISPSTLTINPINGGECMVDEYCDIPIAEATGGQEPYSYQSDSFATGAPPMGTIVDLNGHLTGTPTRSGEYGFGVCVADATRTSKCTQTSATVNENTPPEPQASVKIDSYTCTYKYTDNYGDRHYELSASGSASGPPGAELQIGFNPGYFTEPNPSCPKCKSTCSGWGASDLQTCARGSGPETTHWTVFVPDDEVISGMTLEVAGYEVELHVRIFENNYPTAEEYSYVTCPN
jgi:hypothetical protein